MHSNILQQSTGFFFEIILKILINVCESVNDYFAWGLSFSIFKHLNNDFNPGNLRLLKGPFSMDKKFGI